MSERRPAMHDPAANHDSPAPDERLAATLLALLVQAATRGACLHQMQSIDHYLGLLADERGAGPLLRETCARLQAHWSRCMDTLERDPADAPMTIERSVIVRAIH